jgi:hypothetical protein
MSIQRRRHPPRRTPNCESKGKKMKRSTAAECVEAAEAAEHEGAHTCPACAAEVDEARMGAKDGEDRARVSLDCLLTTLRSKARVARLAVMGADNCPYYGLDLDARGAICDWLLYDIENDIEEVEKRALLLQKERS